MFFTYLRRELRRRMRQAVTATAPWPAGLSRAPRSLVVQRHLAVTLCGQAAPDHDQKASCSFFSNKS